MDLALFGVRVDVNEFRGMVGAHLADRDTRGERVDGPPLPIRGASCGQRMPQTAFAVAATAVLPWMRVDRQPRRRSDERPGLSSQSPYVWQRLHGLPLPAPHESHRVPDSSHFAFLTPCEPALAARLPEICADAPGFDVSIFIRSSVRMCSSFSGHIFEA